MNAEPFLHANLHKQLEPEYVIAQCKPYMVTHYHMEDKCHHVYLVDEKADAWFKAINGTKPLAYVACEYRKTRVKYRKISPPTTIEMSYSGVTKEITCIGQAFGLSPARIHLLDKNGIGLGYITDPRFQKENGVIGIEKVNFVDEFIFQRLTTYAIDKKSYVIKVHSSKVTELEHIDVNVIKETVLQSPLVEKGVGFVTPEREITLLYDNGFFIISCSTKGHEDNGYTLTKDGDHFWYFFHENDLPDKLNEKSITRLFKKMSFGNKNRLEREKQYIRDKVGIDYYAEQNLYESVLFRTLVAARDYEKLDGYKYQYEREGVKEYLTLIIKLIAAYSDPELRGDLRIVRVKGEPIMRRGKMAYKAEKRWEWGTPRIRYIGPPSSKRGPLQTRFYTRGCQVSQPIKNVSKYSNHKIMKLPTPTKDGRTHVVTIQRKGCWKGVGENNEFPTYFAGRAPHVSSRPAIEWMEYIMKKEGIHIQHEQNGGEVHIIGTPYRVDGFCKETNTIYEYHGDYWHGNPDVYPSDEINKTNKRTMGELYENTIQREQVLRDMGFNVVVMWESEWLKKKLKESEEE